MDCVTPSNPTPIAPGEALDIAQILQRTGGTLHADGKSMDPDSAVVKAGTRAHKPVNLRFLRAQAAPSRSELANLFRGWDRDDLHYREASDK
jgi:DNA polymerase gamma 1